MVWGGIHLPGRTPLHLVQGNLTGVRYRDEIVQRIFSPHCKPWDLALFFRTTTPLPTALGW